MIYGAVVYATSSLLHTLQCVSLETLIVYSSDSPELRIDFSDGVVLFLAPVPSVSLCSVTPLNERLCGLNAEVVDCKHHGP